MKEPTLKRAMTPFPWAVELDATIGQARALMREHGVRHLPVVQAHTLRGIVTQSQLREQAPELRVSDVYIDKCYAVDIDRPLRLVLQEMADRHIGSALVTAHGRLAGIFTASDAIGAFASHLRTQFHPGDDDPPEAA